MADFKLQLKKTAQLLKDHALEDGGAAQTYVDNEVIRLSDPYVPFKTGTMKNSARTASDIGSGVVRYKTPYVRYQYYGNNTANGLRGPRWFERMKADHLDDILEGVRKQIK